MILLREACAQDLERLLKFAGTRGFFNLPDDRESMIEVIEKSSKSFANELPHKDDGVYLFVAEDLNLHQVIGTSMIFAKHGTPKEPHFYFQVGSEERFSKSINTGFIHGTLTLKSDFDGPTELGGLMIDPEFRNHKQHLGRQISFVRFLYLALNQEKFQKKLLAELLPPLDKNGRSALWEAIGRRFTNMEYHEADALWGKNKEFIFSLFPEGKIYTTFLGPDAREAIGKVNKTTEPVVHMLKKIGFYEPNHVDPFDGGPHLWADVENVVPIKATRSFVWSGESDGEEVKSGLVCRANCKGEVFRAVSIEAVIEGNKIFGSDAIKEVLGISDGDEVNFTPFYG